MRLIDADELKKIENIQSADFNSIETIRKWIDNQPTAYNLDKVLEELEMKEHYLFENLQGHSCQKVRECIQIIKDGIQK